MAGKIEYDLLWVQCDVADKGLAGSGENMSTALKCPNPSCPYLFDPSTVPPGVVLACPRCGMRFTLGNPSAAPPPGRGGVAEAYPGVAAGYAAGRPPAAGYRPPQPTPMEAAFGEMTAQAARADGEEGPRLPVRESKFQTMLLIVVAAVALSAAGIAVWYTMTSKSENSTANDAGYSYRDVNISFEPPPKPWVPDRDMKARLDSPFFEVYRRENPEAFMAFGARDFKDHDPRPKELREVLLAALGKFTTADDRKEFAEGIPKQWMGLDVQGFKFAGLMRGAGSVEGEAIAVSHKGIGYWFLSWTGANDIYLEQRPAFEVGRSGCKLLGGRENWRPTLPPITAFKNNEIGYTILDSEHVWDVVEDEADVKSQDAKADKYLVVYTDRKKRSKQVRAQLIVSILDVAGDEPLKDARAHIEKHANELADLQGKYVFTEYTGPSEGDPTNPAEGNSPVLLLKAVNEKNKSYVWLYAVSAIRIGNKTVVVYAWCPWESRAEFDTKFIQIAKSLRADNPE